MTYLIAEACVDVVDRACVDECPVDCIYEKPGAVPPPRRVRGLRAWQPACPVEAISYQDDLPAQWSAFTADNARFFTEPLPGQAGPLSSAVGAGKLVRVGADTPLVISHSPDLT